MTRPSDGSEPSHYPTMIPEYYLELERSAVVLQPQKGWLVVEGPDRVAWLQGMVSNDVGRLQAGQGCAAAHLTPQGKVAGLMTVLAEPERLDLLVDGNGGHDLAFQLDRMLIMEDATIEDRSGDVRFLTLVGARAARLLEAALEPLSAPAELYGHARIDGVCAIRSQLGFDLVVAEKEAGRVMGVLARHGALQGGQALLDLLSIEAGCPRWGVDVDSQVTLPELGEDAIDYEKGCYIGQEVVARIKYIGRVNRRLVGLRLDGAEVPPPSPIEHGGREVGRLTSAAYSPAAETVVGMAYLKRGFDTVGTEVAVQSNGESRRAVVADLPFIKRNV